MLRHRQSGEARSGGGWGNRGRGRNEEKNAALNETLKQEDAQAGGRSASDGRLEKLNDMSFVAGTAVPLSCSCRERAHPRTKTRRPDSCLDDQILKSPL